MSEHIIASRITARETTENPLESLHSAIAFSSMDWSEAGDVAWIYGIVVGWDDEDDETGDGGAMDELAQRHGWNEAAVARLRRLRAAFVGRSMPPLGYITVDVQSETPPSLIEHDREIAAQQLADDRAANPNGDWILAEVREVRP